MYHPVLYIAVAIKNAGNPNTHNPFFQCIQRRCQLLT